MMKKLALAALLLAACAAPANAANLTRVEIDTSPLTCDDWKSFPTVTWTNQTGAPIYIRDIEAKFVSASSLISEFAVWLTSASLGMIYSYGNDLFALPNNSILDRFNLDSNWIAIPAGDVLTAKFNCGPVNGGPASLSYAGVVIFYYSTSVP